MDARTFAELADAAFAEIEAKLEAAGLDYDLGPGGVLEVEGEDGGALVINRHAVAQEIWLAAKSGGFHFRWDGQDWRDSRSGEGLSQRLAALLGI